MKSLLPGYRRSSMQRVRRRLPVPSSLSQLAHWERRGGRSRQARAGRQAATPSLQPQAAHAILHGVPGLPPDFVRWLDDELSAGGEMHGVPRDGQRRIAPPSRSSPNTLRRKSPCPGCRSTECRTTSTSHTGRTLRKPSSIVRSATAPCANATLTQREAYFDGRPASVATRKRRTRRLPHLPRYDLMTRTGRSTDSNAAI